MVRLVHVVVVGTEPAPTTTGKIEGFHKTIRTEFLAEATFATIEQAQAALDAWVARYDTEREHQAIGDVAPVRRLEPVRLAPPSTGAYERARARS